MEPTFPCSKCDECGRIVAGHASSCFHCGAQALSSAEGCRSGRLLSWTVVRAPPARFDKDAPYAIGLVELDHGLRALARLEGPAESDWAIGQVVHFDRFGAQGEAVFRAGRGE